MGRIMEGAACFSRGAVRNDDIGYRGFRGRVFEQRGELWMRENGKNPARRAGLVFNTWIEVPACVGGEEGWITCKMPSVVGKWTAGSPLLEWCV